MGSPWEHVDAAVSTVEQERREIEQARQKELEAMEAEEQRKKEDRRACVIDKIKTGIIIVVFFLVVGFISTHITTTGNEHYYKEYDRESLERFLENYERSDIRWFLDEHYEMSDIYDYEEMYDELSAMGWLDD